MRKHIALGLAFIAISACREQTPNAQIPAAVEVASVREMSGASGVRYSATIEPETQVSLAFRVSGYVDGVKAGEGDHVAEGQVLAHIRQSDYQQKAGQATAQKAMAEAAFAQAALDLERAKSLFAANALTKPELDGATARYESAQAQAKGGAAIAKEAGLTLGDTTLTAPISGIVLKRNIERGDLGMPGQPAFILADTRTVKVVFGVPDTMIRTLKPGETINVMTESIPDHKFTGRVARIAPAADAKSRSFDIELHIANPKNELKPGMVASLEITRGGGSFLAIPISSVIRPPKSSEGYAVYVVANDKAQARSVELGEPNGNLVGVVSGLHAGERVIISGPALLTDGQAVRVVGGTNASE